MTMKSFRPVDLVAMKRLAQVIKRQQGIQYARALDAAARAGGYRNYRHAQNELEAPTPPGSPLANPAQIVEASIVGAKAEAVSVPAAPPDASLRRSFNSMYAENLWARIKSTEDQLGALRDGRITGMGFGPEPSDSRSVEIEILRLERHLAEDRALLRMERAKERFRLAEAEVFKDMSPRGSGNPALEAVAELDAANEDFKAAKATLDRLAQQYRADLR